MNFLNLKTGEIFDGNLHDSNQNTVLVHYFDGPQSVNCYYTKMFVIVDNVDTTTPTPPPTYNIELIDDTNNFFLIDLPQNHSDSNSTKIDNRDFYNLGNIKVTNVTTSLIPYPNEDDPTKYLNYFWVGCCSDVAGERTVEVKIDNDKYITIGVDFYGEEETLQKNMENFGVEIPSIFQKAIFTTNLREDLNENIVLNRKRRELLTEYWKLIANKGSYKSLINSLKFFEYGDLVRIEEYWKRIEAGKDIYLGDDLEDVLDDRIIELITSLKRTTYCGLYFLLNRYGEGLDSENNPITHQLDEIVMRWVEEDIALKMTLLGNFFSTYFMPIHLDLLHSTIERRVFTLSHNIVTGSNMTRRDYYNCNMPMLMNAVDENGVLHNRFFLEDTDAYVYYNTIFGDTYFDDNNTFTPNFIGVEPLKPIPEEIDEDPSDLTTIDQTIDNENAITASHWFQGIGKMIEFKCFIPKRYIDPADFIWKQRVFIKDKNDSTNYRTITTYVTMDPDKTYKDGELIDYKYDFSFYLLFQQAGDFEVYVEFETVNSRIYTKNLDISILDSSANYLTPYLVTRGNIDDWINSGTLYNQLDINNFSFCNTEQDINDMWHYIQIVGTYQNGDQSIMDEYTGTNSTIIINLDEHVNIKLILQYPVGTTNIDYIIDTTSQSFDIDTTVEDLQERFPHYWWDLRPRNTPNNPQDDPNTPTGDLILLGIRKAFTINPLLNDQIPDDNREFGLLEYKIHAFEYNTDTTKYDIPLTDMVDEERFYPILHKMTKLEEDLSTNTIEIPKNSTVAIVPTLKRSLMIPEDSVFNWEFINRSLFNSTNNVSLNHAGREPWVTYNESINLPSGYYEVKMNIILNDHNILTEDSRCSFKVTK